MPETTTSCILNKEEYTQYAAEWKAIAETGGQGLTDAFLTPEGSRLMALAFSQECIQWLVSAVGVRQIKARFLLRPGPKGARFSLTLIATDESGYQLSAYYLPEPYVTASTSEPVFDMPIPSDLAALWLANWKSAGDITPAMFATFTTEHKSASLEGYNFDIKDFVSALFGNQSELGQNISLGLGLHEYHSPTATSEQDLTQTFGLVLQAPAAGLGARSAGDASADFDMAAPCPPNT